VRLQVKAVIVGFCAGFRSSAISAPALVAAFLRGHVNTALIDLLPCRHGPQPPVPMRQIFPRVQSRSQEVEAVDSARNPPQPPESILRALRQWHRALLRGTACLCSPPKSANRPSQLKEKSAQEQCASIKGLHEAASNQIDKRRYFANHFRKRRVRAGMQGQKNS
jgi:hypothetical protein